MGFHLFGQHCFDDAPRACIEPVCLVRGPHACQAYSVTSLSRLSHRVFLLHMPEAQELKNNGWMEDLLLFTGAYPPR